MTPTRPVYSARPLSKVLEDIAGRPDPQLRLGELVNEFGERGFGALLFLLGLLSVLIGTIPGTTTVLGIPMLLISFQLIIRRDELYLPGWALRHTVQRKTFADAAAKGDPRFRRVADLRDEDVRRDVMLAFPVGDVWGVGGATARRLTDLGIHTAGCLRDMPMKQTRAVGTVVLERLVAKLRGVPSKRSSRDARGWR